MRRLGSMEGSAGLNAFLSKKNQKLMVHELRTWPQYFDLVAQGMKPFELRKNDRNFEVGDVILLQRFDPESNSYTGEEITALITCLLENFAGIEHGYCILGIHVSKIESSKIIPHKEPYFNFSGI